MLKFHSCTVDGCDFGYFPKQTDNGIVWVCDYCGTPSSSLSEVSDKEKPAIWPVPVVALIVLIVIGLRMIG